MMSPDPSLYGINKSILNLKMVNLYNTIWNHYIH
jgi:hypothetical protein